MNNENPPKTQENKPLLTINEAARYLRVGRTTLYQLMKEGELQTVKLVQGRTHFCQQDLDSFIESKKSKLKQQPNDNKKQIRKTKFKKTISAFNWSISTPQEGTTHVVIRHQCCTRIGKPVCPLHQNIALIGNIKRLASILLDHQN